MNDLSWQKLVDGNANMTYCDGDYVYYTNLHNGPSIHAAIDTNAVNPPVNIAPYVDEMTYRFIKGNKVYYIEYGGLYEKDLNEWKERLICSVPSRSEIVNVSSNYIYYVERSSNIYSSHQYAEVNRVDRY